MQRADRITILVAAGMIAATLGVGTCSTNSRIGTLETQLAGRIGTLETQLGRRIDSLQVQITNLDNRMAAMQAQLSGFNTRLANLEGRLGLPVTPLNDIQDPDGFPARQWSPLDPGGEVAHPGDPSPNDPTLEGLNPTPPGR